MENKKTKIDIILPNYNSKDFIDQTIQSVLNQTFTKWKLIIVDDGSDLDTKKKLKKYNKYKKIKIYWLKKNKGDGFCRAFGLKKAKSKLVAFLDSDDIWKKNKLKLQYNFMVKNKYKFTYTSYSAFKDNSDYKKTIIPPKKFSFTSFIKNTTIATSSMMIDKKILKNIKTSNSPNFDDFNLKCRILERVKYAYCLNKDLVMYRIRKNSLSNDKIRNLLWIWRINRKFNNLNFFSNVVSVLLISFNSIKKYGFK